MAREEVTFFRRMNTKAQDIVIPKEDVRLALNSDYDSSLGALKKVKGYEQVGDNLIGNTPVSQEFTTEAEWDAGTHTNTNATTAGDLMLQGGLLSQDLYGGYVESYAASASTRKANISQQYVAGGTSLKSVSFLGYKVGTGSTLQGEFWTDDGNNTPGTFITGFTILPSYWPSATLFRLNAIFSSPLAQTVDSKYWLYLTPTDGDSSNHIRLYISSGDLYTAGSMWNFRTLNAQGIWKFDETAAGSARTDISGNSNTLTDNNSVGISSDFKRGPHSADFEATSSHYLEITDAAQTGLDLGVSTGFTLLVWIKPETIPGTPMVLVSKESTNGIDSAYRFYINESGKLSFGVSDTGTEATLNSNTVTGNTTLVAGTYYHVAAVFEPSNRLQVSINGTPDGIKTDSIPAAVHNSSIAFRVGASSRTGSHNYYDGLIDDLRAYSAVLTDLEIKSLANQSDATWRFNFNYSQTGNWLSNSLSAIPELSTITLNHRDLASNYYITQVDITSTAGVVQSSYSTDITEGSQTVLRSANFSSGFTYAQNNSFKVKVSFVSADKTNTPVLESLILESPSSILELSPYYKSNGLRRLMAVVGTNIKYLASNIWVTIKSNLTAGIKTDSNIFRASAKNSVTNSTATGGDLSTLDNTNDTTSAINQYQGHFMEITGGPGIGQLRVIQYHTGTSTSTTTSTSSSTTTTTTTTSSSTTTTSSSTTTTSSSTTTS